MWRIRAYRNFILFQYELMGELFVGYVDAEMRDKV
jgi:hypothetical protein